MFKTRQYRPFPWQSKVLIGTIFPTYLALAAWSVVTDTSQMPDGMAAFALVGPAGLLVAYAYRGVRRLWTKR